MAVLAAAAASALPSISSAVSGAVSKLFGGETATDRARVARASALLSAALAGSDAAVLQLLRDAYEPKRGEAGDDRPADGKMSPEDTRRLAVKALRHYVAEKGGLPEAFSAYTGRLNTSVVAPETISLRDELRGAVIAGVQQGAATGAQQEAAARTGELWEKYHPVLIAGGLVIAGFVIYRAAWRK